MEEKPQAPDRVKIIVDTNIIFSALLNTNGKIGDLIFNSDSVFEFYSCSYMQYEIDKHWNKLKNISKLPDAGLELAKLKIFRKINFINERLIPPKTWLLAENTAKEIDADDVDFIALAKHLKAGLWTGDKGLYAGLKKKRFRKVFTTAELLELRNRKR